MKTFDVVVCNCCGREYITFGESLTHCCYCSSLDMKIEKKTLEYDIQEYLPFSISLRKSKDICNDFFMKIFVF